MASQPADDAGLASSNDAGVVDDPRRLRLILITVSLALMMVISSVSGLNVALPDLAKTTGATQSELQWIVDAYTVALAGLLFISGAIGDRFGRRRLLISGLVLFGTLAAVAFFVTEPTTLIYLRAGMGVGAAAVMPTTLSIITTSFPEERRPHAVGIWVGVAGAGAVLGLVMSGLLLEFFSWSSFFELNVVLAVLALIGTVAVIPNSVDDEPPALDAFGAALSFLAVAALVFGIIEGPVAGWGSTEVIAALTIGVLSMALFLWWEARNDAPLLDPRLFRLRGFSTGSASLMLQFFAAFGFFFTIIQYLQIVIGFSPLQASLSILPMAIVTLPLARVAPVIAARVGYNKVGSLGLLCLGTGLLLMSFLSTDFNYWRFLAGLLVFGAGMALAGAPATAAITASLPRQKQGVASAMNDTSREFGSALGIAVLGSVLNNIYRSEVSQYDGDLPQKTRDAIESSVAAAAGITEQLGPQGAQLLSAANEAFVAGASGALRVGAFFAILGAIFVFIRAPRRNPATNR